MDGEVVGVGQQFDVEGGRQARQLLVQLAQPGLTRLVQERAGAGRVAVQPVQQPPLLLAQPGRRVLVQDAHALHEPRVEPHRVVVGGEPGAPLGLHGAQVVVGVRADEVEEDGLGPAEEAAGGLQRVEELGGRQLPANSASSSSRWAWTPAANAGAKCSVRIRSKGGTAKGRSLGAAKGFDSGRSMDRSCPTRRAREGRTPGR